MTELDSRIKLRSSLRCDGIGRLDCAEDLESGQRLAVRWLPLEANGEAAVKACERLPHHPMLPRIRQTGRMGSMAFLALDFPEGSLLSTILGDRLDTSVVLQMAGQLADALATVHAQGVVHGEFGSDSVLMVGDKSYLWDLPLVIANRLTDRRGENRLMQNLVRVVAYLAPERARGAGASREADVYSLGALLCICAGAPMPADSTTLSTVYSIAQGHWVPRVPSTLPAPYQAVIEKMVSADASERPSALEVARVFAMPMNSGSLPTVPDMPMIRLPPELQERANALLVKPQSLSPEQSVTVVSEALEMSREEPTVVSKTSEVPPEAPVVVEAVLAAPSDVPVETIQVEAKVEENPAPRVAVQMPTIELPKVVVVESIPPVMTPAVPTTSVALTDSVSVSAETALAGASVFALYTEPPKQSMAMWWVASGLVVTILSLLVLAVNLVGRASAEMTVPTAPAVQAAAAPLATPVDAVSPSGDEAPSAESTKLMPATPRTEEMVDMGFGQDDLTPLSARTKSLRLTAKSRHAKAHAASVPAPMAIDGFGPQGADDFFAPPTSFQESGLDLKRP